MERNVPARHDITNWSETRWLGSWNPDEGVGLYLHAGRFRRDVDLWWAQTVAYLPGGEVAVDRSWARERTDEGVQTSVFELLVPEPASRITSRFDGAMEVATPRQLATHPRGAGGNSVAVRWELEAVAVRQPWSIYDQLEHKQDWATGGHTEQHHRVSGEITIGSSTYRLDGPGFDDHSHGVRQWDGFGSHIFFNVGFEDFGLHLIAVQTPDGQPAQLIGAVTRDGSPPDPLTDVSVPLAQDLLGGPHSLRATLSTKSGQQLEIDAEVVHIYPMTISEENDNINGLDWDVPGDPLFFTECIARYTTGDGQIGYGHLERSARRSRVDETSLTIHDPWSLPIAA
jgi:hypothetical protein